MTCALLSDMRAHMSITSRVVYALGPAKVRVRPTQASLRSAASVKRAMSCSSKQQHQQQQRGAVCQVTLAWLAATQVCWQCRGRGVSCQHSRDSLILPVSSISCMSLPQGDVRGHKQTRTCVSIYAVRESSLVPHTDLSSKMGTA